MNKNHRDFISAKFINYKIEFDIFSGQIKDSFRGCGGYDEWLSSEAHIRYLFSSHVDTAEQSLCFVVKNQDIILSRVGLHLSSDNSYLYTADNYVLLPTFSAECSQNDKKIILQYFFELIQHLKGNYQNLKVKLVLPPTTELTSVLDIIEAQDFISFDQSVLMVSQFDKNKKIKISRKSYRNLINFSEKNYVFNMVSGSENFKIEEYFNFHKEVSKRQTREMGSWLEQEKWVKNREAFIIECRNKKKLIGYTFIRIFNDSGIYFSGVYSREKEYKGVGHGCLYKALCFSKELDLQKMFLGNAAMRIDPDKLKTITQFKLGFANSLDFRLCLNWN